MYPVNKQTAFNGQAGAPEGGGGQKGHFASGLQLKRIFHSCFGACLWSISSWVIYNYRKHRSPFCKYIERI